MKALDLFCGQGGTTRGFQMAGFEVTGVDIKPQPRYIGDHFVQGDALEFLLAHGSEFDFIAGSPPCQRYAPVTAWRGRAEDHPDLVGATRWLMMRTGRPWVIENVPQAPIRHDLVLCGSQFWLRVRRHRAFESNVPLRAPMMQCSHHGLLPFMHKGERAYTDAMGCEWMSNKGGREAIPPAYTQFIGRQVASHLAERVA